MDMITAQMHRLCSEWEADCDIKTLIANMQQMCSHWNEDRNVEMVTAQTGRLCSQWDEDQKHGKSHAADVHVPVMLRVVVCPYPYSC